LVERKNVENVINTTSGQTFHVQMKDMNAGADYLWHVDEKMN
jgi:allophanate hydrolase subunit 1